jgi:hypothetical protein
MPTLTTTTKPLLPHKLAVGTKVILFGLEDEGVFTVAEHTGHNLYTDLPAYSVRGGDGEIITRVTQPFLIQQS